MPGCGELPLQAICPIGTMHAWSPCASLWRIAFAMPGTMLGVLVQGCGESPLQAMSHCLAPCMFGVLVQSCGELPLQTTMKDAMEMFSWPVTIILAQRSFHAIATCHRLWHCSNMAATRSRNWPVSKEQLQLLECFLVSLPEGKCLHACLIASSLTLMGTKVLPLQSCPIAWGCWSPCARLWRIALASNQQ